jgi:hypothetical protein
MFVGWDWASTTHDVTVLDEAGAVVDRWASRHTEQDLAAALDRLARHEDPAGLPVIIERSSGLVVDRLVAAGHPVVPVHPTAFWAARPRWGASGAKSDPTPATATSSPTTCALTGTGSAGWTGPTPASRSSRPWCGCARTTCVPGPRPATSSAPCWRRTGPGPRRCSTGWPRRSRSPSWPSIRPPRPPPGSARPVWRASAAGTATAAASHRRRCWPGCARHRPPRSASRRPPWSCRSKARSSCSTPCWRPCRARGGDHQARRRPPTGQAAGLAAWGRHHQPRPAAGRGRADPGPRRQRRARRRRVRRRAGHQGLRQDQRGLLPLGRQPSSPQGPDRLRAQLTSGLALGRPPVRRRPRPRQTQSPRHPHRRPCLAPGHLGLLATRHPLQPRLAHRRSPSCRPPNLTQGTETSRRPTALQAP